MRHVAIYDRTEARRKAWVSRRAKYGPRGHAGTYTRTALERRALRLIVRLHLEGTLSEGQCCKALAMDRVTFRCVRDCLAQRAANQEGSAHDE
jgi:hypothetical protein